MYHFSVELRPVQMTTTRRLADDLRSGFFLWGKTKVGGTLGARDISRAVSGFCQVFIVTRAKSAFFSRLRRSWLAREKPLVPRVSRRTPPMQTGMDKDRLIARPNTISNA